MGGPYARPYGEGMLAASSSGIGSVIRGPRQPAAVLGVTPSALYLQAGPDVVAVVTSDAVRLPCAVTLTRSAGDFSLREVPPDGFVVIGDRSARWTSGGSTVLVDVVREWVPASVRPVRPRADRMAELRTSLAAVDIGIEVSSPDALVGLGPGLTPSGDDVLAGYLLGCRAFGLPVPALAGLHRTTALSAALLRYAAAGQCIPQLAALVAALGGDQPLDPTPLLRVGHTSGAALACGVLHASGQLRRAWSPVTDHSRAHCPLAGVGS